MSRRVLFFIAALFFLVAPLQLFAQAGTTEVGFRLSSVDFDDTREVDEGEEALLSFDEDLGYGVSLNHFWTGAFSTELAIDKLGADLDVSFDGGPSLTVGEAEVTMYSASAQWHFRREARVSPYLGIGASYLTGRFDLILEEEVAELDVDNELTWIATGGVSFQVSERVSLAADARYAPYQPEFRDDETGETESIDINPLILSAAIRFRF